MIVALKVGNGKIDPAEIGNDASFWRTGRKTPLLLSQYGRMSDGDKRYGHPGAGGIDEVIVTLSDIRREILVKSGAYAERLRQVV